MIGERTYDSGPANVFDVYGGFPPYADLKGGPEARAV
jgi:hypothetical protein